MAVVNIRAFCVTPIKILFDLLNWFLFKLLLKKWTGIMAVKFNAVGLETTRDHGLAAIYFEKHGPVSVSNIVANKK